MASLPVKMSYALVQYDSTALLEEIPMSWISEDDTLIQYPANYGRMTTYAWKKIRQIGEPPQEDWIKERGKVLTKKGEWNFQLQVWSSYLHRFHTGGCLTKLRLTPFSEEGVQGKLYGNTNNLISEGLKGVNVKTVVNLV